LCYALDHREKVASRTAHASKEAPFVATRLACFTQRVNSMQPGINLQSSLFIKLKQNRCRQQQRHVFCQKRRGLACALVGWPKTLREA